jgi:hypothetical protein
MEAYETVNNEIPDKLDTLLGDYVHPDYLVVVTPHTSGFHVAMAGRSGSKLWDKAIQKELYDWICHRMDAIHSESPTKVEPAGAVQSATKPADEPQVKDQPSNPTSKGSPR